MDFNHYYTNQEIKTLLNQWEVEYPDLISIETIGISFEKQSIYLVTLTNKTTGPALDKPAVWLDANIHATELSGSTTTLYFIHYVLSRYGEDERIKRLVDTTSFYVVPRINPDGAALALSKHPKFIRSGIRPYPWNDLDKGLHAQDIDGDGRILQMRVPDPNGEWKIHETDPRMMVKRSPDEHNGQYYRLFPEGLLEDFDGFVINLARPLQGLDFNRNFPFEWRPENQQAGAGPYPTSEPEIRAVVDYIVKHPNINFALSFHTFSRALLRPFSTRPDDSMIFADLRVFQEVGAIGSRMTGYRNISTFHDFRAEPSEMTTGAFDDWMYDHLGAFVWTVELWDLPTEAGIQNRKLREWYRNHPIEDDEKILEWADRHIGPGGYINWYPYQHPQLGKVEIGGWDTLYTWRNPPVHMIGDEAALHTPFILSLADMLPQIMIHHLTIKNLKEDHWLVELGLENSGFLPTYTSQQALKRGVVRPIAVELTLPPEATIVSGKRRLELGQLEGRSNKDSISSVMGSSPTDNRARASWVISANQGCEIRISIQSERAGTIRKTITLA